MRVIHVHLAEETRNHPHVRHSTRMVMFYTVNKILLDSKRTYIYFGMTNDHLKPIGVVMFQPIQPKRAFEEVAEQIKNAILRKEFNEGDRLPAERELARQFNAGRMTIREALRTLETKGLIKIRKGSEGGAYIGTSDPEILPAIIMDNLLLKGITEDQITEARIGLECAVVASAIENGTKEDLRNIAQNIEDTKDLRDSDNPEEYYLKMINFHILIAEASHNLPFIMFTMSLAQWSRRKGVRIPASEEHRIWHESHIRVFNAINKKDVSLSQRLIRKDIEQIRIFRSRWVKPGNPIVGNKS